MQSKVSHAGIALLLILASTSKAVDSGDVENKCNSLYSREFLNNFIKDQLFTYRTIPILKKAVVRKNYTEGWITYLSNAKKSYIGAPIALTHLKTFQDYLNFYYVSGKNIDTINLGGFDDSNTKTRAIIVKYLIKTNVPVTLDMVKEVMPNVILRCSFNLELEFSQNF